MILKNYDVAELRRLDVAHHLAAQQDHGLVRDLGGARILTRADGSYIYDGEGNAILDGLAGLWCVQVGHGRKELADAAYDQHLARDRKGGGYGKRVSGSVDHGESRT